MKDESTEMSLLGRIRGQKKTKEPKEPKQKLLSGAPEETNYVPFDWKRMYQKKYIPLWIISWLMLIATILLAVYQDRVVDKLRPFSDRVRDIPAGWLIWVAVLFIVSFPPLIGDEIVEILCGIIYGLWFGFGIVALGTYLGQIGNWFAFKYLLRRKAAKLERTDLNYGAMARMVRDSGLGLLIIIRISAIPPHISTAVFSTCDVKFWHFLISTIFSLPRQIFLVYLGTLFVRDKNSESKEKKTQNTIQTVITVVILVITFAMGWYLWKKMKAIKITLLEEQDQRRRAKENMVEGRDEEEGAGEWSSAMDDVRNEEYPPRPVQGVPPPYAPVPTGENTGYYGNGGIGAEGTSPLNKPQGNAYHASNTYDTTGYNSRLY
ncbi:hypothetical protein DM02DRAFT_570404 [Periconia macrospinosa]|uniref:Golgi apparatus membrane protein TVP38 n=1 Tax=Periconia macrospinosa TaxID=97972 RepID=A0A2V1DFI5_9PLEO|nr:hypothetical protein DM02DRAFT_570404 [Periconia macrospinosa]